MAHGYGEGEKYLTKNTCGPAELCFVTANVFAAGKKQIEGCCRRKANIYIYVSFFAERFFYFPVSVFFVVSRPKQHRATADFHLRSLANPICGGSIFSFENALSCNVLVTGIEKVPLFRQS